MALTDKNIVITPNNGASNDPKIVFSGADSSTAAQNITATVYPTLNGMVSFDGSNGQLLTITNSLTGTIFSASDVSGIPSIEVLDTGLVKLAQYNGNVLLGTGTDDGVNKLQVNGNITANAFTGNGANLISVTAGNLLGTIPSAVLGNSTHYIGTTAVTLNRASASLALTGITSIDGKSAAVSAPDGDRNPNTKLPITNPNTVRFDFSNSSLANTGGNYAGVMTYAPWDGSTGSTGDASYQLAFGSTAANGGGIPQLNIRKGIDSTWNTWYTILHSGNLSSYPAVNISGGVANQIHYQTAVNTTNFIASPTIASTFLQWNGSAFTWASAGGSDPTPSLYAINTGII